MTDLQPLFTDPILDQTELDPGYDEHGSDVFRVTTATETVIARSCRPPGPAEPFWGGLRHLFGLEPLHTHNLEPLNAHLNRLSHIRVPQVLRKAHLNGREWVIVEFLPGHTLTAFAGADRMYDFGVQLARIHNHHFSDYGNPTGTRWPLSTFHTRAAATIRWLAENFYAHDSALLDSMCAALLQLPPPTHATYVQPDIGASQYLTDGQRVTAWVDTEACVIAPPALDFIGLEYQILDSAPAFERGYGTIRALPSLTEVRAVYRYLYWLLDVEGDIPLREWMNHPILFSS